MQRFAKYGLAVLGLFFIAGLAGTLPGVHAVAQTVARAALVKNIDEPVRNPYQATIPFNKDFASSSYSCTSNATVACSLVFPAVPAGKRLVIENVSCVMDVGTGAIARGSLYSSTTLVSVVIPIQPLPSLPSLLPQYGANLPTRLFLDAGANPVMLLVEMLATTTFSGFGTVTGYLVDLAQ